MKDFRHRFPLLYLRGDTISVFTIPMASYGIAR
jgi:hypothetical protein